MRIIFVALACAALTGCVTADQPEPQVEEVLYLVNPEHDAHCRSLQMQPGTLVYVQCRLAMSETLRESQERGRRLVQTNGGLPPPEVDTALRDNATCNFNESAKLSVQVGEPADLARAAGNQCLESRARLDQAIRGWQPYQADQILASYESDAIATNQATITEARAFR